MKTLVVGANGFLGSRVALQALNKGWEVLAIYHKNVNNIPKGCKKIRLNNIDSIKDRVDRVFLSVGNFSQNQKQLNEVNNRVTNLFCKKYKKAKIVFVSSVAVYGSHKGIISKKSSFNNPNYYGLSKISGENIVSNHPKYSIIRLTYLYGKGMKSTSFLPTIINQALKRGLITLHGDGSRKQDYLHVNDAADLCIRAGETKENNIYLGVTGYSLSNLEVAKTIQKLIPDCKIRFKGEDQTPSYVFQKDEATTRLGWKLKYSFEKGLKEIIKV
ncbi:NAD-dependent epimerase/dehydratase family protein [Patescibacteria group bacterium]